MSKINRRAFVDRIIGCIVLMLLIYIAWGLLSGLFSYIINPLLHYDPELYTVAVYAKTIYQVIPIIVFMMIYKPDRALFAKLLPGGGNTAKNALIGLGIGLITNCLCVLAAYLDGSIRFAYNFPNWFLIILAFPAVLIQSSTEEFVCRFFLFQHLKRGYNNHPWIAIVFPSLLFSILHLMNPGTDVYSVCNSVVIALVWALMIYLFDSFLMVCLYHTAWNYSQSIIFGLPNSGMSFALKIFKLDYSCTVKSFTYDPLYGVEGSKLSLICDTIVLIVLLVITYKRRKAVQINESAEVEVCDNK